MIKKGIYKNYYNYTIIIILHSNNHALLIIILILSCLYNVASTSVGTQKSSTTQATKPYSRHAPVPTEQSSNQPTSYVLAQLHPPVVTPTTATNHEACSHANRKPIHEFNQLLFSMPTFSPCDSQLLQSLVDTACLADLTSGTRSTSNRCARVPAAPVGCTDYAEPLSLLLDSLAICQLEDENFIEQYCAMTAEEIASMFRAVESELKQIPCAEDGFAVTDADRLSTHSAINSVNSAHPNAEKCCCSSKFGDRTITQAHLAGELLCDNISPLINPAHPIVSTSTLASLHSSVELADIVYSAANTRTTTTVTRTTVSSHAPNSTAIPVVCWPMCSTDSSAATASHKLVPITTSDTPVCRNSSCNSCPPTKSRGSLFYNRFRPTKQEHLSPAVRPLLSHMHHPSLFLPSSQLYTLPPYTPNHSRKIPPRADSETQSIVCETSRADSETPCTDSEAQSTDSEAQSTDSEPPRADSKTSSADSETSSAASSADPETSSADSETSNTDSETLSTDSEKNANISNGQMTSVVEDDVSSGKKGQRHAKSVSNRRQLRPRPKPKGRKEIRT